MAAPTAVASLVVDYNPALRETIARSLTRRGYQGTIPVDAVEGLERLQGAAFDVVITDLQGRERGDLWLWRAALHVRPQLTGRFVVINSEARPVGPDMTPGIDQEPFPIKPVSLHHVLTY